MTFEKAWFSGKRGDKGLTMIFTGDKFGTSARSFAAAVLRAPISASAAAVLVLITDPYGAGDGAG